MVPEKEGNKDAMLKRQLSIKRALYTIKKPGAGYTLVSPAVGKLRQADS